MWTLSSGFKKFMRRLFLAISVIVIIVAIIHVMLDVVFTYQLRRDIRDIKLKIGILLPSSSVAESENAAALYEKAFGILITDGKLSETTQWDYTKLVGNILKTSYGKTNEWTDEQKREIDELIQSSEMQKFYALIEKASQKPACDFNINQKNLDTERSISIHRLTSPSMRLLLLKARVESESGHSDQAVQTVSTASRMLTHFKNPGNSIPAYLIIMETELLLEAIQKLTSSYTFSEKEYSDLVAIVLLFTNSSSLIDAIHADILSRVKMIENDYEKQFFPSYRSGAFNPFFEAILPDSYKIYLDRLISTKDLQMYLNASLTMIDKYKEPYFKIAGDLALIRDVSHGELAHKKPFLGVFFMSRGALSAEKNMLVWLTRLKALGHLTEAGLSLKIYKARKGAYPQALGELSPDILKEIPFDPFTGKEFVYKKLQNGFLVYSLGRNRLDDKGKRNYDTEGKPLEDDVAWKSEN